MIRFVLLCTLLGCVSAPPVTSCEVSAVAPTAGTVDVTFTVDCEIPADSEELGILTIGYGSAQYAGDVIVLCSPSSNSSITIGQKGSVSVPASSVAEPYGVLMLSTVAPDLPIQCDVKETP